MESKLLLGERTVRHRISMRADQRDGNCVSNRLDWRAKSVLGASVVRQVTEAVNNCCVLYGTDPSEGIFAVY
jgi:hypothetical protein